MKVVRKFTLALIMGIMLVHATSVLVRMRREQALFQYDISRDSRVLGRVLGHAMERSWQSGDQSEALELLQHATDQDSHLLIRWIWLDEDENEQHAPIASHDELAPLTHGESVSMRLDYAGSDALYTYVPAHHPSGRTGAIEIVDSLAEKQAYLETSLFNASISALALVTMCGVLAWLLGTALIGRPIARLVEQARAIGRGQLDTRLSLTARDEIGELAREMNQTCDKLQEARERVAEETQTRIDAIAQLRHADRLTTVGTLASGVAHELGTPINIIEGYAQLIREHAGADHKVQHGTQEISRQCQRMTATIRLLLDFARRGGPRGVTCDARMVARETLRMLEPLVRKQQVETHLDEGEGDTMVAIAFDLLQQAMTNILINGLHAMPDGGRLSIALQRRRAQRPDEASAMTDDHEYLAISVEDTGIGMDAAVADRVFEPFFTTKEVGAGTGLGLSVAYGIVQDHGGFIGVESQPGQGTRFTIYLPPEVRS